MFLHVVGLYRACGRPPVTGGRFSYHGLRNAELETTLAACRQLGEAFGRFDEEPSSEAENVSFSWLLAANEHARFYQNASELIDRSSRPSRGEMPENFYLIEEDYFAGESPQPAQVSHLAVLIDLINLLGDLTAAPQTKFPGPRHLIFVLPAQERLPPRTIELLTQIKQRTVELPVPDLSELRLLMDGGASKSLHASERRALFRVAVATVLAKTSDGTDAMAHLVENWGKVLEKYNYDVDCYVSNFSFDKARKEVASAELEFVSKIHGVVGDSTAKLLGLPISLAALVVIYTEKSMVSSYLYLLSMLCVGIVFSVALSNQAMQLRRIQLSFQTMFEQFRTRPELYADSLTPLIDKATRDFDKQFRFGLRAAMLLRVLAWIPPVVGTAFIAFRYSPALRDYVLSL